MFLEENKDLFLYRNIVLGANENIRKIELFSFNKIDDITIKILELSFSTKFRYRFIRKRDWVRSSETSFKPIEVGKFFVTSSFFAQKIPLNKILLIINATLAFGTGHHFTTKCCLEMILYLKSIKFIPKNSIDVGCGTGILSLALAKLFKARVFAIDNDENATDITKLNIKKNGVSMLVKVFTSKGLKGNFLNSKGRYNLILANILYKPIKFLLRDFYNNLESNGYLILSGLNLKQAKDIRKICIQMEFRVVRRISEGNWEGLLLRKL